MRSAKVFDFWKPHLKQVADGMDIWDRTVPGAKEHREAVLGELSNIMSNAHGTE